MFIKERDQDDVKVMFIRSRSRGKSRGGADRRSSQYGSEGGYLWNPFPIGGFNKRKMELKIRASELNSG